MVAIVSKPRSPIHKSNRAARAGLSRRQYDRLDLNGQLSAHLDQWARITTDQDVLHIVRRGLRFEMTGSPSLRRRSVQFQCSPEHRAHLRDCLRKWLDDGFIEETTADGLLLSLLFPVPKSNGDLRWVMDMTYLNTFIVPRKFKMTSVPAARQLIQHNDFTTSLDLQSAFQLLAIDPRFVHLTGFRADDRIFRWRVGVFGIASMPRLFTKVIKPVLTHLHRMGVRCIAYLDDILIAAASRTQSIVHTSLALKLFRSLGLTINIEKSETTPSHTIVFLGFRFDTRAWRVTVPHHKLADLRKQARQVLRADAEGRLSIRRLAALHGKLVAMMPAMQAASFRRHSLARCIQFGLRVQRRPIETQNWDALVSLTRTARRDATWCTQASSLRRANGTPLRRSTRAVVTCTADASGAGWGGVLSVPSPTPGRPPLRFETSGLWHGTARTLSINWQETTALKLTFLSLLHHVPPTTREVAFVSDNTTAVSALRRLGARHKHIGEAAEPLLTELLHRRIFLSATHLAGSLNTDADALSRRHADLLHEWRLSPTAAAVLTARSGPFSIDWFAAPHATHAPRFFTRYPDARSTGTDAFSVSWALPATDVQLMVPPIPLLERVANKIRADRPRRGWLVMPNWPSRPFWVLMASLVSPCLWLDLPNDALVPYSDEHHPMRDRVAPPLAAVPLGAYL